MSQTFEIVCPETKQRIWIGQGWGAMTNFYTGMPEKMEALRNFLNETRGKALYFVESQECRLDFVEYDDTEGGDG